MFLSAYHYDGAAAPLLAAYDRLRAGFPSDAFLLHVCVVTATGITVFDACPSREVFQEFSQNADFRRRTADAGLPQPRIEPLGEVHDAVTRPSVSS